MRRGEFVGKPSIKWTSAPMDRVMKCEQSTRVDLFQIELTAIPKQSADIISRFVYDEAEVQVVPQEVLSALSKTAKYIRRYLAL